MNKRDYLQENIGKLVGNTRPELTIPEQKKEQILNNLIKEANSLLSGTTIRGLKDRFRTRKIATFATAAVIILIAVFGITVLDTSITSAYALEQTIQANHSVRYLHIKRFDPPHDEPKAFWVESDEFGQIKNVRWHMPEWNSPPDGPTVGVWKEDKMQVYFERKNILFIARDKTVIADSMLKLVERHDPRLAVEHLYEQQAQGKAEIEIDEPSDKSESIIVTATYLPESSTPGKREVLFVNQTTKLVTSMEFYRLKDGKYEYTGLMEFYDYNQPIETKIFTLDEVPDDAMRIDQATQEVGLAQGQLSDEEIAVEVVRQFFEALIDQNYAKAGKLMEGIPADRMQKCFGQIKFLRIVSIGRAAPHPNSKTRGLVVPCTVEIEKDGEISQWKLDRLGVRQVFNQPGRWMVFGRDLTNLFESS